LLLKILKNTIIKTRVDNFQFYGNLGVYAIGEHKGFHEALVLDDDGK
jgi:hypothetical protein